MQFNIQHVHYRTLLFIDLPDHTPLGRVAGDSQVSIRNLTVEERSMGVACMEGLSLVHNATYFSTLSVYNGAMQPMVVTATSNGGMHLRSYSPRKPICERIYIK